MDFLLDKINTLLILTALFNVALALIILSKGEEEEVNIAYSLNIVAITGWILSMILFRSANQDTALFWCRVLYTTPTFIASSFLSFTYVFPRREKNIKNKIIFYFLINFALIFFVIWPVLIKEVNVRPGQEKEIIFSGYYWIYVLYILSFFFAGFIRLFKKFAQSKGIERMQVIYLLVGYFIAANFAFVTNLILPWLGIFGFNWMGQVFTVIMVAFTTYAIIKHHLLNVKVIAAEIFMFLIIILSLFDVIGTTNIKDFLWRSFFFLFMLFFAVLLVKSVLREVEQKEKLKKITAELAEANKKLTRLDKAKTEFVSIASHQLRTPLSVIKGYLSMLIEGDFGRLTKKQKNIIGVVQQNTDRLIRLVNIFLDVSRIESGRFQINKGKNNLNQVLSGIIDQMKVEADQKQIKLNFVPAQDLPDIYFDNDKIQDVMVNLIDNAIKYTPPGGRIEVRTKPMEGYVVVEVEDSGRGISYDELDQLFDKFKRGDGIYKVDTTGSGLGLYIAKKIIEAHGGNIWAESSGIGQGSTFKFTLPISDNVSFN